MNRSKLLLSAVTVFTLMLLSATLLHAYTLSVDVSPSGSGSVTVNPSKSDYSAGERVTLTAAPTAGYVFSGWRNGVTVTANPRTITIYADTIVSATFAANSSAGSFAGDSTSALGTVSINSTGGYTPLISVSGTPSISWTFPDGTPASSTSASPGAVTFPDGSPRISILAVDSISDVTNFEITTPENLGTSGAQSYEIQSITGLDQLTGLTRLMLYNTGLTSLPNVNTLTSLQSLYCSHNFLGGTAPRWNGLTNMTLAHCYGNDFSAQEIDQLFIDLDNNGVENGEFNLSRNAGPSSASAAARASLVGKNNTLTYNTLLSDPGHVPAVSTLGANIQVAGGTRFTVTAPGATDIKVDIEDLGEQHIASGAEVYYFLGNSNQIRNLTIEVTPASALTGLTFENSGRQSWYGEGIPSVPNGNIYSISGLDRFPNLQLLKFDPANMLHHIDVSNGVSANLTTLRLAPAEGITSPLASTDADNLIAALVAAGGTNGTLYLPNRTSESDANVEILVNTLNWTVSAPLAGRAGSKLSGLSSPTITYGTASTTLSGSISAVGQTPTGSVSITLNGVTQSAAISSGSFSSSFDTSAMEAGSYTITYSYPGDANCTDASATGTLTVSKADQTALSVTGVPATAQAYGTNFTVGSSGGSGTGDVTFSGSGACSASGTTVTMTSGSGTCSVTATKAADGNYNSATSSAETVAAAKATATVVLSNLTQTYTGSALTPTATTTPSGLAVTWTNAPQTSAGSYAVTATIDDANYQGSAGGTFAIISSPASSVTLTPSVASPVPPGTPVTFTGAAGGGSGNYQYRYLLKAPGGALTVIRDYSTTATWDWATGSLPAGTYQVVVHARNVGSTASYETYRSINYVLANPASSVTLTPSVASPAAVGTGVTFTGAAGGGSGNYQYRYLLKAPGGALTVIRDYSTTATWDWATGSLPTGTYQVVVHARNVGSTASYETYRSINYVLANPASSVTLTPSVASPVPPGTPVTFTGAASGGSGNYQYRYLLKAPGGALTVVRDYSTTATWDWATGSLPAGTYQVVVHARNVGSTASYETYRSINYVLANPASSVTLTPSVASPVPPGTPVTFTGAASGGSGNYQYRYLLKAPGGALTVVRDYSTTATWDWATGSLPAGTYQVVVHARNVGSTASYETYGSIDYVLQ